MYAVCLNQCLAHRRFSIHVDFVIIMTLLLRALENTENAYSLTSAFAPQRHLSSEALAAWPTFNLPQIV